MHATGDALIGSACKATQATWALAYAYDLHFCLTRAEWYLDLALSSCDKSSAQVGL